jgi:hypothetical protein
LNLVTPKTKQKMNTKLLSLAIALCIVTTGFSQLSFGVKAGTTINKLSGKSFSDQFSYGYHAGVFAAVKVAGKFSIQPEVLFNSVNTDTSSNFSSVYQFNHVSKIQLKYLSIPLLLNYNANRFLTLQAGPQFGILMDQNKDLLKNGGDAFKKGDLSMVGGVQLKILMLRLYGRYVVGLNDISNIGSSDKWKSQSFQLGVALAL